MFCQKCGAKVDDEALFCAKCGCAVGGKTTPGAEKEIKNSWVGRRGVKKLIVGVVGSVVITPVCFAIFAPVVLVPFIIFGWLIWAGVFEFFGWGDFFSFKVSKPIKILGLTVLGLIFLLVVCAYFFK